MTSPTQAGMPVPQLVRWLLYGLFPDDARLRAAVTHAWVTGENASTRAVAREFGINLSKLQRAIKRSSLVVGEACIAEGVTKRQLVAGFYDAANTLKLAS